ncbi:MAG: ligase-associated DNA damage response DEXH box helicase [Pseudomonadales bacterium]|nr:ligase-associated DNA damage response DEXH box helicase [Pseudomonadales bacterium]
MPDAGPRIPAGALPAAVDRWLDARGWTLFPFQRTAIAAYLAGESGLVHSATGSGKTLAAILGPLCEALTTDPDASPSAQVLWITPLRALATDIAHNLRTVIEGVGLPWTVELRTGDTNSSARARQRRRLPSLLVTTPESLALLLSYPDTLRQLRGLRAVVVDEWHELLGNKRGVLLELGLARLRRLAPALRTWGLSATLGNTETALQVLLGPGRHGRLVASDLDRPVTIDTLIPASLERFPWGGHIGLKQLDAVADAIDEAGSTLVFCNTRFQAEAWYDALLRRRIDWVDRMALHHGSLDRDLRERVEVLLRDGSLKCVVATSSLDLGVDFTPVDQVIQIGGPKGIARLLQRAGRSGHGPGRRSRVRCAPSHALEMLEYAAARRAVAAGRIEPREPLRNCLDVLAQHLVTRVLGEPASAEDLLAEVRDCHAFATLSDAHWAWTLDFLTRGGPALKAYPEYQRLVVQDAVLRIASPALARRHRMGIGTITADAAIQVQWLGGGRIGHVEESFISRMKPGERFMFGGRVLELVRVRDMTAFVRRATSSKRAIPKWVGGRLPLSSELADGVLELCDAFAAGDTREPEVAALAPLLRVQRDWSALPGRDTLLVERIQTREGHHLFLYPFAGRLVHEGLSALVAWRIGQQQPATFTTAVNDYGFELLTADPLDVDEESLRRVLDPTGLADDALACINAGEMARRRFREIARIAGLVFQGFPGAGKSTRQIQASSGLVYDVLARHDADNRLLEQARREVLEQELEALRLTQVLERSRTQRIALTQPERLTPFAFPLWVDRIQTRLSTERWQDRVARMLGSLEKAAGAA